MTLSRTAVSENIGNIEYTVIPKFSTEGSFVCLNLESEHGTCRKYNYDGFRRSPAPIDSKHVPGYCEYRRHTFR